MKFFTLLIILASAFIVNISFYYLNESYRNFFQGSGDLSQDGKLMTDDYSINPQEVERTLEQSLEDKVDLGTRNSASENAIRKENTITKQTDQNKNNDFTQIEVQPKNKEELVMSPYEKEMLFLFRNYNFTKLSSHGSLLDITTEYPSEYFEYYLPDLTLVFFSTKTYSEVKEIFEIEQDTWNFTINEVDNFGDESFYINLSEGFDDWAVRIVFTKEWKVFWLKISKYEYNNVKKILKNM